MYAPLPVDAGVCSLKKDGSSKTQSILGNQSAYCTPGAHLKLAKSRAHLECPLTAAEFEQSFVQCYDVTTLQMRTLQTLLAASPSYLHPYVGPVDWFEL